MALITILTIVLAAFSLHAEGRNSSFDAYYKYLWGGDHVYINPQRTEVQLKIDQASGAGFRSKSNYGSGLFRIKMKIPDRKGGGGVITSFYLTEAPDTNEPLGNHFEIDFEFLRNFGEVQTNIYANDNGQREQTFKLWFDPSLAFHTYEILWNPSQIVFYVDGIPLRVFKNYMGLGVAYPNRPMHIVASIWHADWAGGVRWEDGPFIAHYTDFGFSGCVGKGKTVYGSCDSAKYAWNRLRRLNATQLDQMADYRKRLMTYDYCADPVLRKLKKECSLN